MPELPEVETVKNALSPHLDGRFFERIETHIGQLRYSLAPLYDKELRNEKIADVRRRGRYIIIELDNLKAFIIHLGMSGSIRIVEAAAERKKHEHVIWHMNGGMTMRFDCPRRFGFVKVCKLKAAGADPQELSHLGVEPLEPDFDAVYLYEASRKRTGSIKNFIMNNSIVVGVGNIYATEALFAAGIKPMRTAASLTRAECESLTKAVKAVLKRSIEVGGTTIADYKSVDGSEGKFVHELQVYGKKGQSCPVCNTEIEMTRLGGRSSCYCPKCQK
ncbi:bifunctional DNA-formamidopyrimidine glycosylase/DNA-(apurinic or apyrimidinic site) lyase [Lentisphaerota bacterium ZTH]|nr:bifunctional DNA-formamidopyrimidine glycosylase/DNA-(apurinic or apyrimidinic site) lyase [Lentisphaerota bacterium]WET07644.1 bifunctional DNA-formamidopyrimidine glycosylase/DNA-(apurinic or apyrimidinic site) lyase [Lentisphaerota bacterium ZTH]